MSHWGHMVGFGLANFGVGALCGAAIARASQPQVIYQMPAYQMPTFVMPSYTLPTTGGFGAFSQPVFNFNNCAFNNAGGSFNFGTLPNVGQTGGFSFTGNTSFSQVQVTTESIQPQVQPQIQTQPQKESANNINDFMFNSSLAAKEFEKAGGGASPKPQTEVSDEFSFHKGLDINEYKANTQKMGDDFVKKADTDGNGTVDLNEYLSVQRNQSERIAAETGNNDLGWKEGKSEQHHTSVFNSISKDGKGIDGKSMGSYLSYVDASDGKQDGTIKYGTLSDVEGHLAIGDKATKENVQNWYSNLF